MLDFTFLSKQKPKAKINSKIGSYGVGGTVAPLMATAIASKGIKWSYFYFILVGLTVLNAFFAPYIFKGSEKDSPATPAAQAAADGMSRKEVLRKSIRNKYTLMAALFIFAYQVTILSKVYFEWPGFS